MREITHLLAHGASEQDVAPGRQNRIFDLMRRYQQETIACPFCNGEGQSKGEACKECQGADRIALVAKDVFGTRLFVPCN
jgi:DnaJ-class molecular chaperone